MDRPADDRLEAIETRSQLGETSAGLGPLFQPLAAGDAAGAIAWLRRRGGTCFGPELAWMLRDAGLTRSQGERAARKLRERPDIDYEPPVWGDEMLERAGRYSLKGEPKCP